MAKSVYKIEPADFYSVHRLAELTLYVADGCRKHRRAGAVKQNKILFLADFIHFSKFGRSISGAVYVKEAYGPCPVEIAKVKRELVKSHRAVEIKARAPGHDRDEKILVPVDGPPAMGDFATEELATLDEVIERCSTMTGKELSDRAHKFIGWELAQMGERIPYETVFVPLSHRFTPDQKKWATSVLKKYRSARAA